MTKARIKLALGCFAAIAAAGAVLAQAATEPGSGLKSEQTNEIAAAPANAPKPPVVEARRIEPSPGRALVARVGVLTVQIDQTADQELRLRARVASRHLPEGGARLSLVAPRGLLAFAPGAPERES